MADDVKFESQFIKKSDFELGIRLIISGKVQKVGFRNWVKHQANKHEIHGWVRNKGHDEVETLFVGKEENVRKLIQACYKGSPFSQVKRIREFPQIDNTKYKEFSILSSY